MIFDPSVITVEYTQEPECVFEVDALSFPVKLYCTSTVQLSWHICYNSFIFWKNFRPKTKSVICSHLSMVKRNQEYFSTVTAKC